MANERYSLYPCTFDDGSANHLTQMDGFRVSPNSSKSSIIPAGALDRSHTGLASARPVATFNTRDLAGVFGFVSATAGFACTSGATFRTQKRTNYSTFATGGSHETWSSTGGFLRPMTLTASQDDEQGASLSMEYIPHWDASTEPFVQNSSVDLSAVGTPSPAFSSRYFLGPVYHNSVQIDAITSWACDFGVNYQTKAFNGEAYPKVGSVITRSPSFTFTSTNAAVMAGLSNFITSVTSSMAFYLQAGSNNATRVAAATAGHLKLSVSSGSWCLDEAGLQGNDDGTFSFRVRPLGTIALSLTSAIP